MVQDPEKRRQELLLEQQVLPVQVPVTPQSFRIPTVSKKWRRIFHLSQAAVGLACLVFLYMRSAPLETDAFVSSLNPEHPSASKSNAASGEALCPQAEPLSPQKHAAFLAEMDGLYGTEEYKLWAYENLGGAVRIPYVSTKGAMCILNLPAAMQN